MELTGETLSLRLIDDTDEDFIQFLKYNGNLNKYLTIVISEILDFERWFLDYKKRERAKEEYFFIIENFNGIRYGTIRIYNVSTDACRVEHFMLLPQRPDSFPYESAELLCQFVFSELMLEKIYTSVCMDDFQAVQLFQKLGFKEVGRTDRIMYLLLKKYDFIKGQWRESHEGYYISWRDWF